MIVQHLQLVDYRNYSSASFSFTGGATAVVGDNGQGKTNLVEALAYLATLDSFRGAPNDALIRSGCDNAVVRATVLHDDGREVLVEAELTRQGRNRVLVNRQRLSRNRDLLGVLRVTVFSPDDLTIVKGSPGERRRFLDDTLVALATKYDALRLELDRVLRQRNTLLKQVGGGRALTTEFVTTLDVWDEQLADLGERFGHARATLVARLSPFVTEAYGDLAGTTTPVDLVYDPPWRSPGLLASLGVARDDDLRRQSSTVGPHRDEVDITLNGLPARTHASQGEQRTLVLALRLAAHRLITERTESSPVLVLDDVLSELDPSRAAALMAQLPAGQVLITTAGVLPDAGTLRRPLDRIIRIDHGEVIG